MLPKLFLIVDDEPDDIFLLSLNLRKTGTIAATIAISDGTRARDYLARLATSAPSLRPDVIFLDLKIPGLGGLSLLEWIRTQPALNDMRVVIVAGDDDPLSVERATALGAVRFFRKYPKPADLAGALDLLTKVA